MIARLKHLLQPKAPGPLPEITMPHMIKAIMMVGVSERGIGRKRLSSRLGIGEGSVRTLIDILKRGSLLLTEREGCKLTKKGMKVYASIRKTIKDIKEVDMKGVWDYPFTVGIRLRGLAKRVKRGIEQRDAAIRQGASAAMTLVYGKGKLIMPGVSNVSDEHPDFASSLLSEFNPREGDVIILAGARSKVEAENGAIAAALSTMGVE